MKTIWKFPLKLTDSQTVFMPTGAIILCVQMQNDVPCLWAEVDTVQVEVNRLIEIHGTGNSINYPDHRFRVYIGTVQVPPLVWHIYEKLTRVPV